MVAPPQTCPGGKKNVKFNVVNQKAAAIIHLQYDGLDWSNPGKRARTARKYKEIMEIHRAHFCLWNEHPLLFCNGTP